jgi:hypothetical protein
LPDENRSRPYNRAATEGTGLADQDQAYDFGRALRARSDQMHANLALRCAWLREHGRRLFDLDGQLAAQLLDFADLLEVADRLGWFTPPGPGTIETSAERRPAKLPDSDRFRRRMLKEALREALGEYWERRAREFEDARPRVDEYLGQAGSAELRARWLALTEVADACRKRARVDLDTTAEAIIHGAFGEVA